MKPQVWWHPGDKYIPCGIYVPDHCFTKAASVIRELLVRNDESARAEAEAYMRDIGWTVHVERRAMQCVECDAVFREDDVINGMCPECGCDEYVEADEIHENEGLDNER